jgi:hypothetical protein
MECGEPRVGRPVSVIREEIGLLGDEAIEARSEPRQGRD